MSWLHATRPWRILWGPRTHEPLWGFMPGDTPLSSRPGCLSYAGRMHRLCLHAGGSKAVPVRWDVDLPSNHTTSGA